MSIRWLAALLLLALLSPVQGQSGFTGYEWPGTEYSLLIPAGWDAPVPGTSEDGFRQTVLLAQNFADNPATRPPGTPLIELTALPILPEETDLAAELLHLLDALDIDSGGVLPGRLLGLDALFAAGSSADGVLFGLGRAVQLPQGGALFMVGRVASVQRENFTATFEAVADSLTMGNANDVPPPQYGFLWRTERTPADGESAFLDVGGLTRMPDDGELILADAAAGIVRIDSRSGIVLAAQPFADEALPTDIALGTDGALYVADSLCGCVRVLANGEEGAPFGGFAADAPRSIALAADGTLYATDFDDDEAVILRAFSAEGETQLAFTETLFTQPLLAADQSGRVFALSDDLTLYGLQEGLFAPFFRLESGSEATAFAFDGANNLLIATVGDGLQRFDNTGLLQNSVELDSFGDLSAVAAAPDGTLYLAESDGSYGAVSALRLGIGEDRIGALTLWAGREAGGTFTTEDTRQVWYYEADAAETITVTAVAGEESFDLDIALRLLAEGGGEVAYAADDDAGFLFNPLDAQLRDVRLPAAGWYAIVVERQAGEGAYRLGLSAPIALGLLDGNLTVGGALRETLPAQRYRVTASGRQSLTITLRTRSGTLDPLLRLLDANGNVLAENDDADDAALGLDAQIFQFDVPFDGTYIVEAARFDGEGEYTLEITAE